MRRQTISHKSLSGIHPALSLTSNKVFDRQLTADDVVALCDMFLVPGVYSIMFKSLAAGRAVLDAFAVQLTCYHAIGYIDHVGQQHPRGMNLYELFAHHAQDDELRNAMQTFFLEQFNYDFIWIVYPKYQVSHTFVHIFLECAFENHVDAKVPIVFVTT